ncbi:MAG TPA: carbamoyltransferase N-terminal domain-containing protein [Chitinophaga sp.]|uniref:carbamoyltransferase N-terminal domain-containing protein n=1 Tax=Chitinophaga sp. TaxID=1869181 RepID=UPI002BD6D999|nr:carbamoyltransferase N-terminal domain-containing protein [Chitinophaga sp.]HVI45573.1 carbamoyltransferase N-terminal domain-containing protein [Chitinophaga sp.]
MIICGLKLTHDSSIAVVDNGRLAFSIELEKLNNNSRYNIIEDLNIIPQLLSGNGYSIDKIDEFVVDGWVGENSSVIKVVNNDREGEVAVAPYEEPESGRGLLQLKYNGEIEFGNYKVPFSSYTHVLNHVMASYATSPFSRSNEPAYVLVWDGGMYPRLYFVDPAAHDVMPLGQLFYMGVNIYSIFSQHFRPFKTNANVIKDELSVAGKVMAYTAYGEVRQDILEDLHDSYKATMAAARHKSNIPTYPYEFTKALKRIARTKSYTDENIIATFHKFLEELLVSGLQEKIKETGYLSSNLCYAGGAALNIKWNSAIRNAGIISDIWICPFPNDSGSAIGAACSLLADKSGQFSVEWNVYSGPEIQHTAAATGWTRREASAGELAQLLHTSQEPVVFLNGKAELGPRALGNRSILASAATKRMKDILNNIKLRESYRPLAPICLEEHAPAIFSPGCKDIYMLFNHEVNPAWRDKIPAICHHDNTARLQTVTRGSNPVLHSILQAYYEISGIPVLCNTSANFKGSGFFPDLHSATQWNMVNYVWCEGWLYERQEKAII